MVLRAVSMLTLVGVIHAMNVITAHNDVNPKPAVKKGCCLPSQYTVKVSDIVYQNNEQNIMLLEYATDEPKKMIAFRVYSIEGKLLGRGIQDYNKGAMYWIQDGVCNSTKLPQSWVKQCIPDDAKYLASAYLGLNPEGFTYDVWMMTVDKAYLTLEVDKTCFPIGSQETRKLENNEMQYSIYGYYNGTASITDPSMFDVPSSCHPPTQSDMTELFAAMKRTLLPHSMFRK